MTSKTNNTDNIDFDFTDPTDNLGYLLWQTTMQWQKQMNRALHQVGLTHTQFVVLIALAWLLRSLPHVTQKDIAEHSKTDRMMVSKILRTLQQKGLINRHEHAHDTRAKCVILTEQGRQLLNSAIAVKNQANTEFFAKVADKNQFADNLKQLIK